MNSRERVLTALDGGIPDRVPIMFSLIDTELQENILGYKLSQYRFDVEKDPGIIALPGDRIRTNLNYCVHPDTAERLQLDAIGVKFNAPLFVKARLQRGGYGIEKGLLTSWEELERVTMPDPDQNDVLEEAELFLRRYRADRACFATIRMGISSTLMSMGYDTFSYMLYDDRDLIRAVLDKYLSFNKRFISNLEQIGFDFIWSFDDIAFGTGPLFSPQVWDEVFLDPVSKVTRNISIPWIYHSDGNLLPLLSHMLPLKMSGIHPLEPGTMDLDFLKSTYGTRLCLIGNININSTLSTGTLEEVRLEVKNRISQLGPGGGFILSDSNSLPYFCRAENVIEMCRAAAEYGSIY